MKNVICGLILAIVTASAEPIEWKTSNGGNGHFYKLVDVRSKFQEALYFATNSLHLGKRGYLVNITSSNENRFVTSLLVQAGVEVAWIGAEDANKDGVWRWADGPEKWFVIPTDPISKLIPDAGYQNWLANTVVRPLSGLRFAGIWGITSRGVIGEWQTFSERDDVSFVVEYSDDPVQPTQKLLDPRLNIITVKELEFESEPGVSYSLQWKTSLNDDVWFSLPEIIVATETTTHVIDRGGAIRRFYRLQILGQIE